jgi:hypothetical protein
LSKLKKEERIDVIKTHCQKNKKTKKLITLKINLNIKRKKKDHVKLNHKRKKMFKN